MPPRPLLSFVAVMKFGRLTLARSIAYMFPNDEVPMLALAHRGPGWRWEVDADGW